MNDVNKGYRKTLYDHRRRRYIINGKLQIQFILSVILAGEFIVLTTLVSGMYIFKKLAAAYASSALILLADDVLMPSFFYTMLVAGAACVVILGAWGLIFSHRIAGPMYRIERICNHVANGEFDIRVGFRRKDMLRPLKSAVQEMICALQEKSYIANESCEKIYEVCEAMKAEINAADVNSSVYERVLDGVQRIEEHVEAISSTFTVTRKVPS